MSECGHGHVTPRADGVRVRCGGPSMCAVCKAEYERLKADAERFKYVLSQIPANLGEVFCQCLTATDDDIIEAIDAARTAKPEVGHE